jgi:hypothetical protein
MQLRNTSNLEKVKGGFERFLWVLLMLVLALNGRAQFTFVTNNGAITITGYSGSGGGVVIPSTINGLPVTCIGSNAFYIQSRIYSMSVPNTVTNIEDSAFWSCFEMTSIVLGNSVQSIGSSAFSQCMSLGNVTLPNSLTSIGAQAFWGCGDMTIVTIPQNVSSIGEGAFSACNALGQITVDPLNSFYSSMNGVLFDKNQTTLVNHPAGMGGVYAVPTGVTSIEVQAFSHCLLLTGVTIPNSVTNIGDFSFEFCALNSVTFGNSVINIGAGAFNTCSALTNVILPDSLISIGNGAFGGLGGLKDITIPTNVTTIGDEAFQGMGLTSGVTIPSSVTNVGYAPFLGDTSLIQITVDPSNPAYSSVAGVWFDKSVTTLIEYPAAKVGGNYTIPNSVTTIGAYAFADCSSLTNVVIPDGVASIGEAAFLSCGLSSVTVPDSVTNLGAVAFNACGNLAKATIPGSVGSIGEDTFGACSSLTSIIMGEGITSIGDGAFDRCSALTSVTIPNSVTTITRDAFAFCSKLTQIIFGNGITSLGDYAAAECGLTGVYFKGNAPLNLVPSVFTGDTNVTVYYLPGTTGWGPTFAGVPTAVWQPHMQTSDDSFGVSSNRFGFNVNWASGMPIVVEASTSIANAIWTPLQTNVLAADTFYFSDPQWTNFPARFYRIRSP